MGFSDGTHDERGFINNTRYTKKRLKKYCWKTEMLLIGKRSFVSRKNSAPSRGNF
jgi:hypothetical protein